MRFPSFKSRRPRVDIPREIPRKAPPKKKDCVIRLEKTVNGGAKLIKSAECKPEDIQAFMMANKEESNIGF